MLDKIANHSNMKHSLFKLRVVWTKHVTGYTLSQTIVKSHNLCRREQESQKSATETDVDIGRNLENAEQYG